MKDGCPKLHYLLIYVKYRCFFFFFFFFFFFEFEKPIGLPFNGGAETSPLGFRSTEELRQAQWAQIR